MCDHAKCQFYMITLDLLQHSCALYVHSGKMKGTFTSLNKAFMTQRLLRSGGKHTLTLLSKGDIFTWSIGCRFG